MRHICFYRRFSSQARIAPVKTFPSWLIRLDPRSFFSPGRGEEHDSSESTAMPHSPWVLINQLAERLFPACGCFSRDHQSHVRLWISPSHADAMQVPSARHGSPVVLFAILLAGAVQQISRGECGNLAVTLSPGGNTTMIEPVCDQFFLVFGLLVGGIVSLLWLLIGMIL